MHSEEVVMLFVLAICVLFVFFSSQVLLAFDAPRLLPLLLCFWSVVFLSTVFQN